MKTLKPRFAKFFTFLAVLGLAVWAVSPKVYAQTPAGLSIQTYAGLTITGAVGTVYSIEYVNEPHETNSDWRCLTFLKLPRSPYVWGDVTGPATGRRFYRAVTLDVPTNMVCVQPGTFQSGIFTMGSPADELDRDPAEGPQITVTISRGFLIGKYEVTQREYLAVMGSNPSYFNADPSRPVEQVQWYDATNYCARLTQQEQKAGRLPPHCLYRLPTEAEWEYACRAGTTTRFSYGDDLTYASLPNYAWFTVNSGNQTHPVGQKKPNPWGIYDMHGNVWEWCQDYFSTYPGGQAVDPQGPATGSNHVLRGGSWYNIPSSMLRSAFRRGDRLSNSMDWRIGFRVILAPGQP